jgi:hypothetical protein
VNPAYGAAARLFGRKTGLYILRGSAEDDFPPADDEARKLSGDPLLLPRRLQALIAIEPVIHVSKGMNRMAQGRADIDIRSLQPREFANLLMEIGTHAG